jgi:hypothetical protein
MIYFTFVLVFFPFSILAAVPGAAYDFDKDIRLDQLVNPVIIPGARLGSLRGKEIPLVRVFAVSEGGLTPVPFQIDQVDSRGGWVWGIVYRNHLVNDYEDDLHEGIGNLKWRVEQRAGLLDDEDPGQKKIIDANDVLVFMAKDMGSRSAEISRKLDGASNILEIEMTRMSGNRKAWAYIAYYPSDPPPYSPVRYVHYLPDTGKVVSSVYSVEFSKEHIAVLEQLEIGNVQVLDRTKLRGTVRLGWNSVGKTVYFNENNIQGHIDGYIDGPVRVVKRNSASLYFGAVFSSPEIHCDQYFYLHHSEIPVRLPFNIFMNRVSLLMAADYHNSPFRRAYIGGVPVPARLRETVSETNILEGLENVSWMALEGDVASVVSMLTLPEEIKPFAVVTPYLVHNSTLTDPPESYRGSEPEAGYVIKTKPGFPAGSHTIVGTYLYLPRPFLRSDAEQILGLVNGNEPSYRVSEYEYTEAVRQSAR